jgi:hypothetical protein
MYNSNLSNELPDIHIIRNYLPKIKEFLDSNFKFEYAISDSILPKNLSMYPSNDLLSSYMYAIDRFESNYSGEFDNEEDFKYKVEVFRSYGVDFRCYTPLAINRDEKDSLTFLPGTRLSFLVSEEGIYESDFRIITLSYDTFHNVVLAHEYKSGLDTVYDVLTLARTLSNPVFVTAELYSFHQAHKVDHRLSKVCLHVNYSRINPSELYDDRRALYDSNIDRVTLNLRKIFLEEN